MARIDGRKVFRVVPSMELSIDLMVEPGMYPARLATDSDEPLIIQSQRAIAPSQERKETFVDVNSLAADFEALSDPERTVAFLNMYGSFFNHRQNEQGEFELSYDETVSWGAIQLWQEWFKKLRVGGRFTRPRALEFLIEEPRHITAIAEFIIAMRAPRIYAAIGPANKPFMIIETPSIVEALGAVIYVEHLAGVRRALCKNCETTFELTANYDKSFCKRACALRFHKRLTAARRRRRAKI